MCVCLPICLFLYITTALLSAPSLHDLIHAHHPPVTTEVFSCQYGGSLYSMASVERVDKASDLFQRNGEVGMSMGLCCGYVCRSGNLN